MQIPGLKKGYEHLEAAPIVLLALLKKFSKLNRIDITNEKLIGLLNEYKNPTYKDADLIWEPKE